MSNTEGIVFLIASKTLAHCAKNRLPSWPGYTVFRLWPIFSNRHGSDIYSNKTGISGIVKLKGRLFSDEPVAMLAILRNENDKLLVSLAPGLMILMRPLALVRYHEPGIALLLDYLEQTV